MKNKDERIKFLLVDRKNKKKDLFDMKFNDYFYTIREKMDIWDFNFEEFIKD